MKNPLPIVSIGKALDRTKPKHADAKSDPQDLLASACVPPRTQKEKMLLKGAGAISIDGPIMQRDNTHPESASDFAHETYEMRKDGLCDRSSLDSKPICGMFTVVGTAASIDDKQLGALLSVPKDDKSNLYVIVAYEKLRDTNKLAHVLEETGIQMPFKAAEIRKVGQYIYDQHRRKKIVVLKQEGITWIEVDGEKRPVAVLGAQVIATNHGTAIAIPPSTPLYEKCGVLSDWKTHTAKFLIDNPILIAVIAAALSAPLKALFNLPLLSLLLAGPSGSGKTTIARFVNSLFGRPNDPHGWSGTVNGLEALALRHNDAPLPLDELGEGNAGDVLTSVYRTANGVQKSRANTNGSLQEPEEIRTVIIATGEVTMAQHAAASNQKIRQGHEARMATVWLDELYGAITSLNAFLNPESVIRAIDQLGRDCFGVVWSAHIESLITDYDACRAFIDQRKESSAKKIATVACYASLSAFERRVLDGMTSWALAGEWAIWSMVLPLPEHAAVKSVKHVYQRWLERTRSAAPDRNAEIVTHFRDYFQTTRGSNFVDHECWAHDEGAVDGYTYFTEKHSLYLMIPGVFRKLSKQFGYEASIKALDAAGYLAYHKGGKTWQLRLGPDRLRVRFIAIENRIFFDD